MNQWPQILVALWLVSSVVVALGAAARPKRLPFVLALTRQQQRVASLGFAVAAISEASLLIAGGFFKGLF